MKQSTIAILLVAQAHGEIVADGPWTGNDWFDAASGVGIENGVPVGSTEEANRRITSPQPVDGDVPDYLSKANVQLVQSFLDEEDWEWFFPFRDDFYTLDGFLKAVGKFPAFCGENNRAWSDLETCKREVATVFAHFVQESSYNSAWEESANGIHRWRQGLYYINELGCHPGSPGEGSSACNYHWLGWAGEAWPPQEGAQYHGRGPFQLSYNFNYGAFSNIFVESTYDSKMHFLEHPELVAQDGYTAFASGLWFYMTPQSPKPSMHDVVSGFYEPNAADTAAGIRGGFGSTINIINGGIECGGGTNSKAESRGEYYLEFLSEFGIDTANEEDLGCATEQSFPTGGTGDALGFFQAGASGQCELVTWQTQYSMYARDDYKRCVCDSWGNGEDDCPQAGAADEGDDDQEEEDIDDEADGDETDGGDQEDGGDDADDSDTNPSDGSALADLFAALEAIQNAPHYDDELKSRTLYQVDTELDYIAQKIKEFHDIMLDQSWITN